MLLVCYNAGYQVGKLTGLPSRRKGIMSMARYHYTRENENGVVLYLESEPAEDAMDEFDDDEHTQILEREVGYIFPLMEVEPTICIELKDE